MANTSTNIFYSAVDSNVQNILENRKGYYGATLRNSAAHNFLHKKMAWAEASAINTKDKRGAVLTTNTQGGIGANSLYSGASYSDQGRFIVKPHITSVKLSNEGHLGSLKKCEVAFSVYSLNDLDTVQAFFDIGADIAVSYGWNNASDGSNPGKFVGLIYNFSYTVNPQGGFNCVSYGIGRGIVLASANITTGFPHDVATSTSIGEQSLDSDLINKIKSDIELFSSNLQKNNDIFKGYGLLEFSMNWGSQENSKASIKEMNITLSQKAYYISLEKLIELINTKVLSSYSIAKRLKELNAASNAAGDYLNLGGLLPNKTWEGFPYSMPASNVEQAMKEAADGSGIKIICDGNVTLGCIPPENTAQITYLVSGNPFEVVFPGYNRYINVYGTSTHDFEFTDYKEFFKSGDLSKIMLNVDWLEKQFRDIGKDTQDNEKSTNQTISKFLINIFNSISDNSGTRFNLSMVSNPNNEDEFYIVDINYRDSKKVDAYELTTVENNGICRAVSLTSKVPSAVAAAAYTQGINSPNAISSKAAALVTGGTVTESEDITPEKQLMVAMNKMDSIQGPNDSVVPAMQSALKRVYEKTSGKIANTNAKNAVIYPIDFSATLDGIEGFVFGNVITTNYLPKIYKRNNVDIAFTITKIDHTIQNNDWTTTLSTVCRVTLPESQAKLEAVVPDSMNVSPTQSEAEKINAALRAVGITDETHHADGSVTFSGPKI